jgi:hypothetical protein
MPEFDLVLKTERFPNYFGWENVEAKIGRANFHILSFYKIHFSFLTK